MKTYTVTIVPYVFEYLEGSNEIYEVIDLSFLPEFTMKECELYKRTRRVDANNIEEALSSVNSYIKFLTNTPVKASKVQILCYRVTFNYHYGRSFRERSFYVWTSLDHRKRFLRKNRSYLTDEQISLICSASLPSLDRYLTTE